MKKNKGISITVIYNSTQQFADLLLGAGERTTGTIIASPWNTLRKPSRMQEKKQVTCPWFQVYSSGKYPDYVCNRPKSQPCSEDPFCCMHSEDLFSPEKKI